MANTADYEAITAYKEIVGKLHRSDDGAPPPELDMDSSSLDDPEFLKYDQSTIKVMREQALSIYEKIGIGEQKNLLLPNGPWTTENTIAINTLLNLDTSLPKYASVANTLKTFEDAFSKTVNFHSNYNAIHLAQHLNQNHDNNGLGNDRIDFNDLTSNVAIKAIQTGQGLDNKTLINAGADLLIEQFIALRNAEETKKFGVTADRDFPAINGIDTKANIAIINKYIAGDDSRKPLNRKMFGTHIRNAGMEDLPPKKDGVADIYDLVSNFSSMVAANESDDGSTATALLSSKPELTNSLKTFTQIPASNFAQILAANTDLADAIEKEQIAGRTAALEALLASSKNETKADAKGDKKTTTKEQTDQKITDEEAAQIRTAAINALGVRLENDKEKDDRRLDLAIEKKIKELFEEPWVIDGTTLSAGLVPFDAQDGSGKQYLTLKGNAEEYKLGTGDEGLAQNRATYAQLLQLDRELRENLLIAHSAHSTALDHHKNTHDTKAKLLEITEAGQNKKIKALANTNDNVTINKLTKDLRDPQVRSLKNFKTTESYKKLANGQTPDFLSELSVLWSSEEERRYAQLAVIMEPKFEDYTNGISLGDYNQQVDLSGILLNAVGLYVGIRPNSNLNHTPIDPHKPWEDSYLNDGFFAEAAYEQYKRPMKTDDGWKVRIDEDTMFNDPVEGAYYTKEMFEQEALTRFVKGAVEAGAASISTKDTSGYPKGQAVHGNGTYWDGKTLYDTGNITQAMHGNLKDANGGMIYYNPPYRDLMIAMAATRNGEGNTANRVVDGNKVAAAMFGSITDEQAFKMAQRLHYFDQDKSLSLADARKNIPETDQIIADIKDRLDGPFHYFTLGSSRRNDHWDLKAKYSENRRGPYTNQMKLNATDTPETKVEVGATGNSLTDDQTVKVDKMKDTGNDIAANVILITPKRDTILINAPSAGS